MIENIKLLNSLLLVIVLGSASCENQDKPLKNSGGSDDAFLFDLRMEKRQRELSNRSYLKDDSVYELIHSLRVAMGVSNDSNVIVSRILEFEKNQMVYSFEKEKDTLAYFIGGITGEGVCVFNGTKEDSVFIQKQIETYKNKYWVEGRLAGISDLSKGLIVYESEDGFNWDDFKNDGYGCFQSFSYPLLNADSTKCVLKTSVYCHNLLGSGGYQFFEKKNGKWIRVGYYTNMIS